MGMVLTIGGNDLTEKIPFDSIQINDSLLARGDSLSFRIPLAAEEVTSLRPQSGQPVQLFIDGELYFEGDVGTIAETRLINADYFNYEVVCQDYTRQLDRHLVVLQEVGPAPAGEIIRMILALFAPSFAGDLSGIEDGATVGKQQFDYTPVSAVLDQLASDTQMVWFLEPGRRIVFTSNIDYQAPLGMYDVDGNLDLGDFDWNEAIEQLKNRIYLKDAAVKDSNQRVDQWLADGNTSFFKAFSEPYDENVTVTGTKPDGTRKEYQAFLDPLDNDDATLKGTPGTVAICILNWGIRFPLEDLPEAGELVEMVYNPVRPGDIVYMVEDPDSQAMMREREGAGSDGVYEHMVSLPDVRVESEEPIEAYGRILLDRIAWPEVTGSFKSQLITNWRAGQSFVITSSKRDLYDARAFWKEGVRDSTRVWVQSVSKRVLGQNISGPIIMEATIQFANSPIGRV